MALQFAKLPLRTKIIGLAGIVVVAAGISALGYQAYKTRPSAETQGSPCKFAYQIVKADNRFAVYVTDKKTYDTIKANPSSIGSMTRIATLVGNGEMTVNVDPDLEMYAIGFKDDGTFIYSGVFTCRRSNAYNIAGDLKVGQITVSPTGTPISATPSSPAGTTPSSVSTSSTKRCIKDPNSERYLYVTKIDDNRWIRSDSDQEYNDAQVQQYSQGGMYESFCQTQPSSTASSAAASTQTSSTTKCIDQGGEYVLFTKGDDGFWNGTQKSGNKITIDDGTMQGYISDSSKCSATATPSAVPSQNAQPAVGAASSPGNPLYVPGFGTNSQGTDLTLPYGNSSITFQVVRYSRAANEGKEFLTAVGGVKFTLTGRIAKTTVSQKNKSNVAFAQAEGNAAPGEGRLIEGRPSIVPVEEGPSSVTGQATQKTQTDTSKALGGAVGTTSEVGVKYTDEEAGFVARAKARWNQLREAMFAGTQTITIKGTVPDNGTKSMILITGLAAGSYNLTLSKSGYETQSNISFEIGNGSYNLPRLHIKPSPGAEPPSIDNVTVTKDSRKIEPYSNLYYADSSYVYKSDCPDAGWQTQEMINECPHIEYPGGEPVIVSGSGDPYYSPTLGNLMGYYGQYCMGPQASIYANASDNTNKISPLKAAGIGALGGILGSVMGGKDIGDIKFGKEVLLPAGVAAMTASLGTDLNFNIGQNLCPNYQMPYYPSTNNPYQYTNNPFNQGVWNLWGQGSNLLRGIF
jgi:hypothetical protein